MRSPVAVTMLLISACSTSLPTEGVEPPPAEPVQLGTYRYIEHAEYASSRQSPGQYWTLSAGTENTISYEIRREDRALLSVGSVNVNRENPTEIHFHWGPHEPFFGAVSHDQVTLRRTLNRYTCERRVTTHIANNWFAGGQPTTGVRDIPCTFQYLDPAS